MNASRSPLSLVCFSWLALASLTPAGVSAQNALPGQPGQLRPVAIPQVRRLPNASGVSPEVETLSGNYRVAFSGVGEDGKPLGELVALTCAPRLTVSGPLNSGPTPTAFTVGCSLAEKEGDVLLMTYQIGFRYPVTTSVAADSQKNGASFSNVAYQDHSAEGMLRMKPGTAYEVLKAAGVTYTITISKAETK